VTDSYEWLVDEPMLHEPVMVVMLTGRIDAAGAAASAAEAVAEACDASPILRFDDDTYIDFRARRPVMQLRDGVNSNLVWSTIEMSAGRPPGGGDVVLLTGPEPDMAWHRFGRAVADLATSMGVRQMVAFGAYPFAAPHTRPPGLACSSPSVEVLASVPFARSSVDVPAGVAATLEHALHALRIPALGIWVQVPHYVSGMSYPASAVALLDGFAQVTGIRVDAADLRREVASQRARIDQIVAANDDHAAMVRQLEEIYDAAADGDTAAPSADEGLEMRSGDELAAEIQRFLRDQDG
jgi:PAC2 family